MKRMSIPVLKRTLTAHARNGLCNRLKVLLSARALAEVSGREMQMLWSVSHGCNCSFEQLFQNQWNVSSEIQLDEAQLLDLTKMSWHRFPDVLAMTDAEFTIRHYDWLIDPTRYPHHAPLQKRCIELMNELEPIPNIQARAQTLREQLFRDVMIGVHLRRGDFVHIRPDTVANFEPATHVVDEWLTRQPNAGILLCTDDGAVNPSSRQETPQEGIVKNFMKRYGERVVLTQPRSLDRATPAAIQDALVDLLLLRQTDFFVGTTASSFSELAVFGRANPARFTGAPTDAYRRLEFVLKWTGIQFLLNVLNQREFGEQQTFVSLWYRYKSRLRARVPRAKQKRAPLKNPSEYKL